jgi:hypothetical protein
MPLGHAEIGIEVVGQRVLRDQLPAHLRLQSLDVRLRSARYECQRGVARIQVGRIRYLVSEERAAHAGPLGVGAGAVEVVSCPASRKMSTWSRIPIESVHE